MAALSYAFTISRAAEMQMEPEDGKLWIHGPGEQETIAFTNWGMENLPELLVEHNRWEAQHPRS